MTISPCTQQFALKRHGLSPVCFRGALLVQGRSHGGHVLNDTQAAVTCSVAVYESGRDFIAHISLCTSSHMGELSFVHASEDPVALRNWFSSFDPDLGVDLADIVATIDGPSAANCDAFTQAAASIEQRLIQVRDAYYSALHTAFGRTSETKLAA